QFLATENIFENIRIEIRAEPAERVELKTAARDVGIKRGEFERTQIELHADAMPLVLQSGGDEARGFVGGGFQFEMEANAIGAARKTGGVEKRIGAGGIEIVMGNVPIVGPVIGRQEAVGGTRVTSQKISDQRLAIGGAGERLTNFAMRENRIVKIERDVSESRAGRACDFEIGIASQSRDRVRRQGIDFDVAGAFAKFERANQSVWNDAEANAFERRRAGEITWIAVEDDFFVGGEADETKRSGADGMLREARTSILWDDADSLSCEVQRKRGVGRAKMKDDRVSIGRGDGVDECIRSALRRFDCSGNYGVEREFHVGGSERLAVGESHVAAKMEDVRLRVGHFPFFGEVGREVEMLVALKEAVENEEVEMLGKSVGANARVEIRRHGFEQEIQRVGIACGPIG